MLRHPIILKCQTAVEEGLEQLFKNREPVSLFESMLYPVRAGGKRIRPVLLCLSCQAVGGDLTTCLPAALAVELLHTFTLVHDDIMDQDETRRGLPTVHKKWDEATAILAGDGLVTLAYETLLSTRHSSVVEMARLFTQGLLVLCEGQSLDKTFESATQVSQDQYLDMITKKTAKLLEVSCLIGGMAGNASNDELKHLQQFSHNLGMAFQIQDDLLDVIGDETTLGKPVGSDLVQKKKTFLVIYFLNHAHDDAKTKFRKIWKKKNIRTEDIKEIIRLFHSSGTISETQTKVAEFIKKAEQALNELTFSETVQAMHTLNIHLMNRMS